MSDIVLLITDIRHPVSAWEPLRKILVGGAQRQEWGDGGGGFHFPGECVSRSCHPTCSTCAWSCEAGVSLDCGPQTETVVSPCFVGRISYWPGAHQIALGILLVSFPGVGVTAAFFLSHFILMTCFKVFSQKCLFLFLLFCSAEDETLGLACARPELYRRATPPGRGTRCYIRLL